jgi:pimeloyl-ACP methyl ester carboxylesterase
VPGITRPAGNDTATRTAATVAALLTLACNQSHEQSATTRLTIAPCVVAGVEGRCGSLTVPENRTTRRGRTIDLNIVVIPARSRTPAADPIFFLAGGPGQAATALASAGAFNTSLQQDRDSVFVDQRGTGASNPLECELPGSPADPQGYLGDVFQTTVFEKCRDELAPKADVTQYTTAAAADDLDDVRVALGYGRVNLIGGSYGTRAALIYMRRHPGGVRAAVLNGVAPPSLLNPLYHARNAQSAIDAVFAECAGDRACHAAFPRLAEEFHSVVERLEKQPARVSMTMPGTSTPITVTLSRYAFAETIRMMLYGVNGSRQVPLVVHEAFRGDFSAVVQRAMEQRRGNSRLQHGLLLATTCAEDVARIREDEIAAATTGTFLGPDRVTHQREVCAIWPRAKVADEDVAPVHSDAPVLLLSGTLDPVTPPIWAEDALRSLPNGRHLVVPGAHGVGGLCVGRIIHDFLNAGSAKDLATSCTQEIRLPPFVTR